MDKKLPFWHWYPHSCRRPWTPHPCLPWPVMKWGKWILNWCHTGRVFLFLIMLWGWSVVKCLSYLWKTLVPIYLTYFCWLFVIVIYDHTCENWFEWFPIKDLQIQILTCDRTWVNWIDLLVIGTCENVMSFFDSTSMDVILYFPSVCPHVTHMLKLSLVCRHNI